MQTLAAEEYGMAIQAGYDHYGLRSWHYQPYDPQRPIIDYADAVVYVKLLQSDWEFFEKQIQALESFIDLGQCNITSYGNLALLADRAQYERPDLYNQIVAHPAYLIVARMK